MYFSEPLLHQTWAEKSAYIITLLQPCWIYVNFEWVPAEHGGSSTFQIDAGQLQSRCAGRKEPVYVNAKKSSKVVILKFCPSLVTKKTWKLLYLFIWFNWSCNLKIVTVWLLTVLTIFCVCSFIFFFWWPDFYVVEQPRLEGILKDHLVQPFVGKGARRDYVAPCPIDLENLWLWGLYLVSLGRLFQWLIALAVESAYFLVKPLPVQLVPVTPCLLHLTPCEWRGSFCPLCR